MDMLCIDSLLSTCVDVVWQSEGKSVVSRVAVQAEPLGGSVSEASLRIGSNDGGKTLHVDDRPLAQQAIASLASYFHLAPSGQRQLIQTITHSSKPAPKGTAK